jgi:hypothetical protein
MLVLAASAIGAVASFGGLLWTYLRPESFAANLSGSGNADSPLFSWLPHLPFVALLAATSILVRIVSAATMRSRRGVTASSLSGFFDFGIASIFEIGLWDIPFVIACFAAGLYYLHPVLAGVYSLDTPSRASELQVGCAVSRMCLSLIGITFLGHATFAAQRLWRRGGTI